MNLQYLLLYFTVLNMCIMKAKDFFLNPKSISQKQYEALRAYYVENKSAKKVAEEFGYKHRGFTSIVLNFNKRIEENNGENLFFTDIPKGRKPTNEVNHAKDVIVRLRKQYLSLEEIKVALDALNFSVSEKTIYNILKSEGFARLPRRQKSTRQQRSLAHECSDALQNRPGRPHFPETKIGLRSRHAGEQPAGRRPAGDVRDSQPRTGNGSVGCGRTRFDSPLIRRPD